ncbi:MAG: hypothetical protein RLZZ453_1211 [Chlamydiota bacterium]|jgi:ribonuclease R
MHPKGFGFVIPDPSFGLTQDIFIPKHLTDTAVDSDLVEVALFDGQSEKGPEGKIINILKRGRDHVSGVLQKKQEEGIFLSYVPLLGASKLVLTTNPDAHKVKVGSRVILKVKAWGSSKEPTTAEISHVLGSIDDPSCDIKAAIEEFDLPSKFPHAAVNQAKKYGSKVLKKELKDREDLTSLECFTIDPDTARDFDDALSLSQDRKGVYHLGVHIADVAHYVPTGSALDKEAYKRANSTYLPGTCIPMLPEQLSNELCSLKEKQDRLTVSVLMDFDKQGNLLSHSVVRACIHSKKRFTYEEAKEVLDGKKKSIHKKTLEKMVKLCGLLKKKRQERGSIDFAMTEFVIILDKKGMPTGVKKVEYDITHQLVEEFMLKANEMVAVELKSRDKQVIYRIHEEPHEENFSDFLALARSLGFSLSKEPSPEELQKLFKQAATTPYAHHLSVSFIRSMRLAQYSPDNVGHFGLSLDDYCHFTSPIRRYSDLIIQRLLFNEEGKELMLEKICRHCSDQERVSFRAEMSVKTLKKLRLLKTYFKEDPERVYPALITKIKPFGCFFEIQEIMLEGFLHISEIGNDYFIYQERQGTLTGKHTGKTYKVADPLSVKLQSIDLISLQTRWESIEHRRKKR